MDPTVEQLAQYIVQELGRGVPEPMLRASLMQHGWTSVWIDAAFQNVRQHYVTQQPTFDPLSPQLPTQSLNRASTGQYAQTAEVGAADPRPGSKPHRGRGPKVLAAGFMLLILLAIIVMVIVPRIMGSAQERAARDNDRRDDLAQLLSDLSHYFVANNSYPTLAQLNDPTFRTTHGFKEGAIKDPQWSTADTACTKAGQPVLSEDIQPHCYVYKTSTSEGAPCDNVAAICTRMTVVILLEKGNVTNQVSFDRNNELEV